MPYFQQDCVGLCELYMDEQKKQKLVKYMYAGQKDWHQRGEHYCTQKWHYKSSAYAFFASWREYLDVHQHLFLKYAQKYQLDNDFNAHMDLGKLLTNKIVWHSMTNTMDQIQWPTIASSVRTYWQQRSLWEKLREVFPDEDEVCYTMLSLFGYAWYVYNRKSYV